ncbi:glycerate kinase [Zobellella taiwanensis]|uniref:Glycerate kinase n=1 Tax=Zobellella taiwanensis TaxID=347535 RepID=A0A2P7QJT1_9GAMM|nr:glycerate kinase [Zobellella taiwanensis]PSJ38236.1 glycerate kinase [Zobellella taiwanensis]
MKIVVAIDSFKGSMSAEQACSAAARGLQKALPDSSIICMPVADGGEGLIATVKSCPTLSEAQLTYVDVTGPYRSKVKAAYLRNGRMAIIEMAQSCGLELTPIDQRDVRLATSYGLGELVMHALESGCNHLIIGLGGSATNDAGMGFAQALGVDFYNREGVLLPSPARAADMQEVYSVDISKQTSLLKDVVIEICCDVSNPLLGSSGATMIYGAQKGATADVLDELEMAMAKYASTVEACVNKQATDTPGAGAAGGMGAALIWFTDALLKPGIQVVLDLIQIDDVLTGSNLVITGEGKIDKQTAFGKVPVGVAQRAATQGIPVVALAGTLDLRDNRLELPNIHAMSSIIQKPMQLTEAMADGEALMEMAAEQLGHTLRVGHLIYAR